MSWPDPWLTAALVVASGFVLWGLGFGVRRRIDVTRPRCAGCDADVRPALGREDPVCPACRLGLDAAGAVRFERGPRRPGLIAASILVAVIVATAVAWPVIPGWFGTTWLQVTPTVLVLREVDAAGLDAMAEWRELSRRAGQGSLSPAQFDRGIEILAAHVATPAVQVRLPMEYAPWRGFLEHAYLEGILDDGRAAQLDRTALGRPVILLPGELVAGQTSDPCTIDWSAEAGPCTGLTRLAIRSAVLVRPGGVEHELALEPVSPPMPRRVGSRHTIPVAVSDAAHLSRSEADGEESFRLVLPADVEPGRAIVRFEVEAGITGPRGASVIGLRRPSGFTGSDPTQSSEPWSAVVLRWTETIEVGAVVK